MGRQEHLISTVLCFAICCMMSTSGYFFTKRDPPSDNLLPYQVKKISHQHTGDGFDVTIQLRGTEMPEAVYLQKTRDVPELHFYGMPSANNEVEFHTATGYAGALFIHPRSVQVVFMKLEENGDDSVQEMVLTELELSKNGGRDITFNEGEDANVNLSLRDVGGRRRARADVVMTVKNPTENSNSLNLFYDLSSFPFHLLDASRTDKEQYINFNLTTSSGNAEGLLQMHVYKRLGGCRRRHSCRGGGYVILQEIPVYQNGHDGPFPANYIGRMNLPWHDLSDRSRSRPGTEYCSRRRSECQVFCWFVGDRPTPVQIDRVSGDLTPSKQVSLSNNGFHSIGYLQFSNLTTGAEAEFQCKATSGPNELSYTTRVLVVHDASIDYSRSGAILLANGSVVITCWAEGTPAPDISFLTMDDKPLSEVLDEGTYHLQRSSPSNSMSKAELRIDDPAAARSLGHLFCVAENTIEDYHARDREYIILRPRTPQRSSNSYMNRRDISSFFLA